MNDSKPGDEQVQGDDEAFVRFLRTGLRRLPDDAPWPADDAILAYVQRRATADQSRQVQTALAGSSSLRRYVADLAEDLEALETPGFDEQFASQQVPPIPESLIALVRPTPPEPPGWIDKLREWVHRRPIQMFVAQIASITVAVVLAIPAYRGLYELPKAEEKIVEVREQNEAARRELTATKEALDATETKVAALNGTIESLQARVATQPEPRAPNGGLMSSIYLMPSTRGPSSTAVQLGQAGRIIPLLFEPSMMDVPDDARVRIQVLRAEQNTGVRTEVRTARNLKMELERAGGLLNFGVPREFLVPGDYKVRFEPLVPGGAVPQDFPFRVIEATR